MSAPVVLGLAVTRRQVGLVVLTLERLERNQICAFDAADRLVERVRTVVRRHGVGDVAVTVGHTVDPRRLVDALGAALGATARLTVCAHATLRSRARRAQLPRTNRARAAAYAERYPSLRPRVPSPPPLRALRTAFERHHEVVFRALVAADLALRDRLTLELPLYELPPTHPA